MVNVSHGIEIPPPFVSELFSFARRKITHSQRERDTHAQTHQLIVPLGISHTRTHSQDIDVLFTLNKLLEIACARWLCASRFPRGSEQSSHSRQRKIWCAGGGRTKVCSISPSYTFIVPTFDAGPLAHKDSRDRWLGICTTAFPLGLVARLDFFDRRKKTFALSATRFVQEESECAVSACAIFDEFEITWLAGLEWLVAYGAISRQLFGSYSDDVIVIFTA